MNNDEIINNIAVSIYGKEKVDMKGCYCAGTLVFEAGDLPPYLSEVIDDLSEDDLYDYLYDLLGEDVRDLFEFKDDVKIETGSLAGILDGDDYSVGNDKKVRIYGSFFSTLFKICNKRM